MSVTIKLSEARRLFISRGLLLMLYVLASGPLYAGSQNSIAPLYEPLAWVRQHTPLAAPLSWYWGLFQPVSSQLADNQS